MLSRKDSEMHECTSIFFFLFLKIKKPFKFSLIYHAPQGWLNTSITLTKK